MSHLDTYRYAQINFGENIDWFWACLIDFTWPCVVLWMTAYIGTGQVMGWGHKAIEIRAVETGHLDGVFMHKKAQKLKFLCERNDKVWLNQRKLEQLGC